MKKDFVNVKVRISSIRVKDSLGIYKIPLKLKVSIINNTDSLIKVNQICIMVKCKYLRFYILPFYKSSCKINIKSKKTFKCSHGLQNFIYKYNNSSSRQFIVKLSTNVGIIKSNNLSIKGELK